VKVAQIVLADDDPSFAELLKMALEGKGHQVTVCPDGFSAAMAINDLMPQLIIMDIKMPGPYGISVWHSLQQNPETAQIPVIFVTGFLTEEAFRQRVPANPRVRFMNKPIDLHKLHAAIEELLSLRDGGPGAPDPWAPRSGGSKS